MEIDPLLDAIAAILVNEDTLIGVPEITAANAVVWHAGSNDPAEDVEAAIGKCQGVSVLIYDLGGDEDSDGVLDARAIVELYVCTPKRNRKKTPSLRLPAAIRNDIMRKLHRAPSLRNEDAFADCRVRGYAPLEDGENTAYRITLAYKIFLDD